MEPRPDLQQSEDLEDEEEGAWKVTSKAVQRGTAETGGVCTQGSAEFKVQHRRHQQSSSRKKTAIHVHFGIWVLILGPQPLGG